MRIEDYRLIFELIQQKKPEEAMKTKNGTIPNVLYKYYSLTDDKSLNISKITYLADHKLYLSPFSNFNDPFEGSFLIFDKAKLEEKGWDRNLIEDYWTHFIKTWKCTCLSDTNEQNMPMWAYYANNHHGFCVEYALMDLQKKYIYEVTYEDERQYANSIITHILNEAAAAYKKHTDPSNDFNVYNMLIFYSLAAKHVSWKHEHEYRIISPFDDFAAMPQKIFIGLNCEQVYREQLIEIGKQLCGYCKVYEMFVDRDSKQFELQKRQLL